MTNNLRGLLFFLSFLIAQPSFSQTKEDTTAGKTASIYFFKDFCFDTLCSYNTIDTTLNNFHRYDIKHCLYYDLGTPGQAHQSLIFFPEEKFGFQYRSNPFQLYLFNQENILYYNTKRPFSQAFVILGSVKDQQLRLLHTQNIKENWNFSASVNRISAEGYYPEQRTSVTSFALTSNYLSLNKRYGILGNIIINRLRARESGGIYNILPEYLAISNRLTLPVNLRGSHSGHRGNEIFVKQHFNVFKRNTVIPRSARNDSIETNNDGTVNGEMLKQVQHDSIKKENDSIINHIAGGFSHSFNYSSTAFSYSGEPDTSFYADVFLDSLITKDSTSIQKFVNQFAWNSSIGEISYSAGLNHELINTFSKHRDSVFYNLGASAGIGSRWLRINLRLRGNYIFSGVNPGDHKLQGEAEKVFNKKISVRFSLLNQRRRPDNFYNNYISNHFIWNNNFNKIFVNQASVEAAYLPFSVKAGFINNIVNNYIYFNEKAQPAQHRGVLTVQQFYLEKNFTYRAFHFDNRFIYQAQTGADVIRVPQFLSKQSIYLNNKIFKNRLELLMGFDLLYWSSYYSYNYMPATQSFYLQNEIKTGGYPFMDFFLTFKVKKVRAMFRIDHVNEGLTGYNYFVAPSYPATGRIYRLGLNWIFWD